MKSAFPCTYGLTLSPWIYLVPQFRPESILMLGFGDGTAAGLIRRLYGPETSITGVDIEKPLIAYDSDVVIEDARDYIKRCGRYQCIIVDLFEGYDICGFVFEKEFADLVSAKCDYLIIHADANSDMKHYERLHKVGALKLNTHRFHYFLITKTIKGFPFHA